MQFAGCPRTSSEQWAWSSSSSGASSGWFLTRWLAAFGDHSSDGRMRPVGSIFRRVSRYLSLHAPDRRLLSTKAFPSSGTRHVPCNLVNREQSTSNPRAIHERAHLRLESSPALEVENACLCFHPNSIWIGKTRQGMTKWLFRESAECFSARHTV